jgi:hypothetical protein
MENQFNTTKLKAAYTALRLTTAYRAKQIIIVQSDDYSLCVYSVNADAEPRMSFHHTYLCAIADLLNLGSYVDIDHVGRSFLRIF